MPANIEITVLVSSTGPMTKQHSIGADGRRVTTPAPLPTSGTMNRCAIGSDATKAAEWLAYNIPKMNPRLGLILGRMVPRLDDKVTLCLKADDPGDDPGRAARTKQTFVFEAGAPAFMLLDFDRAQMPPAVAERITAMGGFTAMMRAAFPAIASAATVSRASTSAGLFNADTDERYPGGGEHLYVAVRDGSDIPRATQVLHQRLALAGLGWALVTDAGTTLIRTPIDVAVAIRRAPPPPTRSTHSATKPAP